MIPAMIILLCLQDQDRTVQELKEKVESLEKKVQDLETKQAERVSANPLTVLNPTLTVIGNFLWRLDDRRVLADSGDAIDDTATLRELEIDLRAAIDPYADGVAIVALESEVPGEFEVAVEEMLINVKSLPVGFWEEPPLGTKLKIGRMRTEFGRNNRLHLHDLPQSNRPLAIEEFLGEEGHVADGASATSFLPSPGETALELTLQALQGGDAAVAQDKTHAAWLANVRLFVPVTDEHSFDLAVIGFYGTNDPEGRHQSRVASVDWLYRWKPLRGGQWNSVLVGGQLFYADHEAAAATTPFGYFVFAQVQAARDLYLGTRLDQTDTLDDDADVRRRLQPYVSWYVSEFFRVRATYQHTWSDLAEEDSLDTFLVEINVIFGAHPPEPFWVNR